MPTNALVVPDARMPGFPIVNEGAYDEIEGRVSELRGLESLWDVQMVTFTRYRPQDYLSDFYQREEYVQELGVTEGCIRC